MPAHVERGILRGAMHLQQVIGRAHRVAMLAQFITHCVNAGDVKFERMGDVAKRL